VRIVGARLDHNVAAGAFWLQGVAGEVRQVNRGIGPAALKAEAGLAVLFEEARAKAERQGQLGRRES
jgi:hypothetical protein